MLEFDMINESTGCTEAAKKVKSPGPESLPGYYYAMGWELPYGYYDSLYMLLSVEGWTRAAGFMRTAPLMYRFPKNSDMYKQLFGEDTSKYMIYSQRMDCMLADNVEDPEGHLKLMHEKGEIDSIDQEFLIIPVKAAKTLSMKTTTVTTVDFE